MKSLPKVVAMLLFAGTLAATAAPNIPSSELPGRERERFTPSPVDRFTDPRSAPQRTEPLWQWDCKNGKARSPNQRTRAGRGC